MDKLIQLLNTLPQRHVIAIASMLSDADDSLSSLLDSPQAVASANQVGSVLKEFAFQRHMHARQTIEQQQFKV